MTTGILGLTVQVAAASALGNTACHEPLHINLSQQAKPNTEAIVIPNPSDTQGSITHRPVNPINVHAQIIKVPAPWWFAQDLSAFEDLTDKMPGLEFFLQRAREPLEAAFGSPVAAAVSVRHGNSLSDQGAVVMIDYTGDRASALLKLRHFEQTWLFNQDDDELDNFIFYLANE